MGHRSGDGADCRLERVVRYRPPHEGPEAGDMIPQSAISDDQADGLGRFEDGWDRGGATHGTLAVLKGG